MLGKYLYVYMYIEGKMENLVGLLVVKKKNDFKLNALLSKCNSSGGHASPKTLSSSAYKLHKLYIVYIYTYTYIYLERKELTNPLAQTHLHINLYIAVTKRSHIFKTI